MGRNIVLIGLPGCGKTTVGRLLAARTGRVFVDTDELAAAREGRSIPEIFAAEGEGYFRDVETACAREAARLENAVVATGGGIVLRAENMAALAETGIVCFLNRSVEEIAGSVDISGRPLLKEGREKVYRLHRERDGLYRKYAAAVCTGRTPEEAAEAVLRAAGEE